MAGRIPQSFINELLARADLVEIIERRVPLKKAGRNYTACCPFHNEKTPSFSVNPDKQFYYCFGCGVSGNAISFLMEYEGQEFVAAVEDLASQLGVEVPREAFGDQPQKTNNALFPLMEKVAQHYQQQLKRHPTAVKAVNYLKNRGLSGEIAKQYGIGYAPEEWQNLSHLDKDKKKLQKNLVETGMMIEKENGHAYDRFRDRIMFPIRNRRGQVLGFGGRVIDKGEPKYLNSPETTLFHKGKELYGLYEMRRQLRNVDHIIIVEGYMDVVALAQFGIYNATATLGTATTSDHLLTLFRICPKVVFCFDGDKAGRAAAIRALNHALPLLKDAREVRMMFLPEGEDPDTMVRNIGAEAFKEQVEIATTLFDYLLEYLTNQVDMNTFEGPAKLVHLAKPFSQLIKDPILSARFQQRLSELSGLNEKQLKQVLPHEQPQTQKASTTTHTENPEQSSPSETTTQNSKTVKSSGKNKIPFRRAIALLLQFPEALPAADLSWLADIEEPGAQILNKLIQLISAEEGVTTAMLIENWRGHQEEPHLTKLATMDLLTQAENAQTELCEITKHLEKSYLIDQWDSLIEKSRLQPLSTDEKDKLKQLQIAISAPR
ncbi:DNA primase [Aliikangiella coralliicola]|uniref:DNA primase n=1 Tax=Aliikangiella coralliicola TaxID=2592383 RepID=A0A545UEA1_9GAMM|nr:DNA primase [Aliikangiella coralliicola]TQV87713.1 DNA primase [Aliikangiella coralliicola]